MTTCDHRYKARTKKEFMEYIKDFDEPYLIEGSENAPLGLLNEWFAIRDKKDWLNKRISLPGCKLLRATQKDIDNYYKKEEKLRTKYTQWLSEALEQNKDESQTISLSRDGE